MQQELINIKLKTSVIPQFIQQIKATGKLNVTYHFWELFEGMGEQLFSLAEEEVHVHLFHSSEL
jgi:hypothetical protein